MAMLKKTVAQKTIALILAYGPKEIAELDAEIAAVKRKLEAEVAKARRELDRLTRLRDIVAFPKSVAAAGAAKTPTVENDDDVDDVPQITTVVNEADKPALRRKIVTLLKEFGVRRNDSIASEIEVSKEVVLDLLAHVWFTKANNVGGFTLTAEGHIEANRLAGK